MSWIPKKTTTSNALAQVLTPVGSPTAQHTGFSLETPVVMTVRRLPAPVYATLMDINALGARVRSLVLMERGTEVEFDLSLANSEPITISARIENRRNAASGARFEYRLSFDVMPEEQILALVRAVREVERRAAMSRTIQKQLQALPTTDSERRTSYRALSAFLAHFRREGELWHESKIGDISATGVRMMCEDLLAIGTLVDMRLTLPSSVLDIYPEETAMLDIAQAAPRRIGRSDMRRPFEEMALRGRVVTRFQPVRERECYGVAFIEI
ncbi:MAG TPA: hypothetical protein VF741_07780, partial [Candidatus Aquilonibacter sp.]